MEFQTKKEFIKALQDNQISLYDKEVMKCIKKYNNDKEVMLLAIQNNRCALKYASKELQEDREIALCAVKNDGFTLKCLSKELQADKEFVLLAVKNNGCALKCLSKELQADKEICLEAVKKLESVKEPILNKEYFFKIRDCLHNMEIDEAISIINSCDYSIYHEDIQTIIENFIENKDDVISQKTLHNLVNEMFKMK